MGFTVEPQPVGKVVQLFCGEVQRVKLCNSTQSKPKSICDRSGKLENTEYVFVKGETSSPHEIDEKRLHEELRSLERSWKSKKLSENIRVKHVHDRTEELVEQNSSSAHTVKEQFASEENCDIASFNADNEFNRATNEENIDFNIPGVPNSAVKRSHDVIVHNLIQQIENLPQRHALQSDFQQQHRQFSTFSKKSRDVIKVVKNSELCELFDVDPKAQCKVGLSYWDVDIVYCTCGHFLRDDTKENKKYVNLVLDFFSIPNYFIKEGQPYGIRYGKKKKGITIISLRISFLSIHDHFIRDARFRKTTIEIGRTEEVIRERDKLASIDHTRHA